MQIEQVPLPPQVETHEAQGGTPKEGSRRAAPVPGTSDAELNRPLMTLLLSMRWLEALQVEDDRTTGR